MIRLRDILTENTGSTQTIVQTYTQIEDPSNPGTMVQGTFNQAKVYYNTYISTKNGPAHPNPPTFEKFQIIYNKLNAQGDPCCP